MKAVGAMTAGDTAVPRRLGGWSGAEGLTSVGAEWLLRIAQSEKWLVSARALQCEHHYCAGQAPAQLPATPSPGWWRLEQPPRWHGVSWRAGDGTPLSITEGQGRADSVLVFQVIIKGCSCKNPLRGFMGSSKWLDLRKLGRDPYETRFIPRFTASSMGSRIYKPL